MRRNLFFSAILLYLFLGMNAYGQSLIPELKKSINTYCKITKDFGNFKQCKGEVYSLLRKKGTDYIFKVNESYRKDFFVTCNRHKKDVFKFNECLFRQVSKILGEDISLEDPVLIITEKNSDEDEVIKVIEMPASTEQNIIAQVISASFYVESGNTLTEGSLGSAVKINETQLATACHVVTDKYNNVNKFIRVSHVRDETNFKDAKLVKYDFLKDACILETSNISHYRSVPKRSFTDLKIFEKIYAVGNPNGFIGRTAEGKIKNLYSNTPYGLKSKGYDPIYLIETDAPLDKGNSGGGLYDTKGRLIGIVSTCDIDIEATEAIKNNHYPCHRINPINWSIPIDTFEQLVVF